jgi:hypothetical protein
VLLAGPRQAGKTTLSKQLGLRYAYLNFDSAEDRRVLRAEEWDRRAELVIFDELHKMRQWKSWLKGVYDTEIAVVAWAAQMGTITFHPWPVRRADVDHPDELRIDLDPQPGTDFEILLSLIGAFQRLWCIRFLPHHLKWSSTHCTTSTSSAISSYSYHFYGINQLN